MDFDNLAQLKPISNLPEPSERIRLRKAFGVSQVTLAEALNVSRKTIERWETGKTEPAGTNRSMYARILAMWSETEKESA